MIHLQKCDNSTITGKASDLGPLSQSSAIPTQASPSSNCLNPNVTVGMNSVGIADLRDSGLIPSLYDHIVEVKTIVTSSCPVLFQTHTIIYF